MFVLYHEPRDPCLFFNHSILLFEKASKDIIPYTDGMLIYWGWPSNPCILNQFSFLISYSIYPPGHCEREELWVFLSWTKHELSLLCQALWHILQAWPFNSQDLFSNSPYCLLYSSCDVSLENLVLDQLMIP